VGPLYKHNCKDCNFLDTIQIAEVTYDLYECPNSSIGKRYTARHGDRAGAYVSYAGLVAKRLADQNPVKVAWLKSRCN